MARPAIRKKSPALPGFFFMQGLMPSSALGQPDFQLPNFVCR